MSHIFWNYLVLRGAATTCKCLLWSWFFGFLGIMLAFRCTRLKPLHAKRFIFIFDVYVDAAFIAVNLYYVLPHKGPRLTDSCSDYCLYIYKLCGFICGDFPWRHFFLIPDCWTVRGCEGFKIYPVQTIRLIIPALRRSCGQLPVFNEVAIPLVTPLWFMLCGI